MRRRGRLLLRIALWAVGLALVGATAHYYGAVYIGGWSMAPTYTPGDVVIYRRPPVRPGLRDVVLIAPPGSARGVVHRVVGRSSDGGWRTKGDANTIEDNRFSTDADIAGVVVADVPSGRATRSVVGALRWCYNHVPIANMRR